MNDDRALRKILMEDQTERLPYGFDNRVMPLIFREAEKMKKRAYLRGIGLVSAVSLALISGGVLVLRYFFDIRIRINMPRWELSPENHTMLFFFIYIALLALILLGLDGVLRRIRKRSEGVGSGE
ncbi:MAG: hypothetical protein ACOYXB_14500 [Bacteroidota bacterium]